MYEEEDIPDDELKQYNFRLKKILYKEILTAAKRDGISVRVWILMAAKDKLAKDKKITGDK